MSPEFIYKIKLSIHREHGNHWLTGNKLIMTKIKYIGKTLYAINGDGMYLNVDKQKSKGIL